jgi:hypothetical protein
MRCVEARAATDRLAERVNAAAYGTVLVLVALSTIEIADVAVGYSYALIAGVGFSTWIAHLFAELLGEHVRHGEAVSWSEGRRAAIDGSPILASAILPGIILFCGRIELFDYSTARNVAILVAVLQLSLVGGIVARSTPGSPTPAWWLALSTAIAGVAVVILKVALGH